MATRRTTKKTAQRRKEPADDTLKVGEARFCEALGELAGAVGELDFEEQALAFIARLAPHDFTIMTRYSRFSPPDYLVHDDALSERMARRYLTEFYRFDPFFDYWREQEKPGVVWLGDLSSQTVKRGRYVREFLVESGIGDELGMFLPPMGHASVALFLERKTGRFGERDRERLRRVYPIIAGFRRAHVSTLFGRARGGEDAVAALESAYS